MKKLILILMSALSFGILHIRADVPGEIPPGDEDNSTKLEKEIPVDPTKRPKAPDMQCIYCQYDGEELTFSFAFSEGECELMLTDSSTGMTSFYTIDSSELFTSVYVGTIGQTHITLTTARGVTYTGTIRGY